MNGEQAIREIRRHEAESGAKKAAKILVTTMHTDPESIAGALRGRCNGCLVKPIDPSRDLCRIWGEKMEKPCCCSPFQLSF